MKISSAMEEIRKIRDENSLRHLRMTDEEISKENEEVMKWFADKIGKSIEVLTASKIKRKEVNSNGDAHL